MLVWCGHYATENYPKPNNQINNYMMDKQTYKEGLTLTPYNLGSRNDVWLHLKKNSSVLLAHSGPDIWSLHISQNTKYVQFQN
jgi:hypothetical protein